MEIKQHKLLMRQIIELVQFTCHMLRNIFMLGNLKNQLSNNIMNLQSNEESPGRLSNYVIYNYFILSIF